MASSAPVRRLQRSLTNSVIDAAPAAGALTAMPRDASATRMSRRNGLVRNGNVTGRARVVGHGLGGSMVGQPFECDRMAGAVAGASGGKGEIDPKGPSQTAVWTWKPECGYISIPAAWSS